MACFDAVTWILFRFGEMERREWVKECMCVEFGGGGVKKKCIKPRVLISSRFSLKSVIF